MDVHDKLEELIGVVESSRAMPMSASCILNRGEVLALLAEIRALLPADLRAAQLLLADRDAVVEEGRREVQRMISAAEQERLALTAETEVVSESRREAARIRQEAAEQTRTMRAEVDDYVDAKLATFEVVLEKTLTAVRRGRDKLSGRSDAGDLAGPDPQPGGGPDHGRDPFGAEHIP